MPPISTDDLFTKASLGNHRNTKWLKLQKLTASSLLKIGFPGYPKKGKVACLPNHPFLRAKINVSFREGKYVHRLTWYPDRTRVTGSIPLQLRIALMHAHASDHSFKGTNLTCPKLSRCFCGTTIRCPGSWWSKSKKQVIQRKKLLLLPWFQHWGSVFFGINVVNV